MRQGHIGITPDVAGYETAVEGEDMRAVVLTLDRGQTSSMHYHSMITDSMSDVLAETPTPSRPRTWLDLPTNGRGRAGRRLVTRRVLLARIPPTKPTLRRSSIGDRGAVHQYRNVTRRHGLESLASD